MHSYGSVNLEHVDVGERLPPPRQRLHQTSPRETLVDTQHRPAAAEYASHQLCEWLGIPAPRATQQQDADAEDLPAADVLRQRFLFQSSK